MTKLSYGKRWGVIFNKITCLSDCMENDTYAMF